MNRLRELLEMYLDKLRQAGYGNDCLEDLNSDVDDFLDWVEQITADAPLQPLSAPPQGPLHTMHCPHCNAAPGMPHNTGCLLKGIV